jgi:hypothetical protein
MGPHGSHGNSRLSLISKRNLIVSDNRRSTRRRRDRPHGSGPFRERAHPPWLPHRLVQLICLPDLAPFVGTTAVRTLRQRQPVSRPSENRYRRVDSRPKSFLEPSIDCWSGSLAITDRSCSIVRRQRCRENFSRSKRKRCGSVAAR